MADSKATSPTEMQLDPPEPVETPHPRRLRARSRVRSGLATSLAAAALAGAKKPPADEE
jgi:hypothetical protein